MTTWFLLKAYMESFTGSHLKSWVFITLFLSCCHLLQGQEAEDTVSQQNQWTSEYVDENEQCFRCHGQSQYTLYDNISEREMSKRMHECWVINREAFYSSNHKSFACIDCHNPDFSTFPHPLELRTEELFSCIDCHGNDETYAAYHFEQIAEEYAMSIHAEFEEEGFSCWKCHNPHTYRISIRNTTNLGETIAYDNSICLDCHSNFSCFDYLIEWEEVDIIEKHDWLPNQTMHFANVRCIECHTRVNNDILVAHHLVPKEEAVKCCVECHSKESRLLSTLYKFKAKEQRTKAGFLNGVILEESYVIGATENIYLNTISLVIFLLTIAGVAIHIFCRISMKKTRE